MSLIQLFDAFVSGNATPGQWLRYVIVPMLLYAFSFYLILNPSGVLGALFNLMVVFASTVLFIALGANKILKGIGRSSVTFIKKVRLSFLRRSTRTMGKEIYVSSPDRSSDESGG